MDFRDIYKVLEQNKYYVFSYDDILSFFPREKKDNLKRLILRWKNKGWISVLKRGLFELSYPGDFNIPDTYIANKVYNPSYVSLETALSIYSIIPEVSMAVTSVTSKSTRKFKNRHGLFLYRAVKPEGFTGYTIGKEGIFNFLIAEPEKALIDYLYFKAFRSSGIDYSGERLDKKAISRLKFKKIENYAKIFNLDLKGLYAYL